MPRWMSLRFTQVSILGMMALLLVLGGCGASSSIKQRPTTPPIIPTATTALPAGWYRSPTPGGRIFANTSGFRGLVVSPAKPSEVAGCGLSLPGGNVPSMPAFLFSVDTGRSWQTHAITGASPTTFCAIVADTILPQTFVIQTGINSTTQLLVTRDNGATWSVLNMPPGLATSLYGAPGFTMPALVDGHLITDLLPVGQAGGFRLYDIGLVGGSKLLDAHMPQPPEALAVDPTDPGHLFVAIYGAFGPNHNSGFRLYETRDAGATWQDIHEWRTSLNLGIWASPDKRVYALDLQDTQTGLYSTSDGVTWQFTDLNNGDLTLGPSGAVVLFSDQNILSFDPQSGHQSLLGTIPPALASSYTFVALVLDHPSPALILANALGTFVLPLASLP